MQRSSRRLVSAGTYGKRSTVRRSASGNRAGTGNPKRTVRNPCSRALCFSTEVPNEFWRIRSRDTRSRSTSAVMKCEPLTKRSDCASRSPLS